MCRCYTLVRVLKSMFCGAYCFDVKVIWMAYLHFHSCHFNFWSFLYRKNESILQGRNNMFLITSVNDTNEMTSFDVYWENGYLRLKVEYFVDNFNV